MTKKHKAMGIDLLVLTACAVTASVFCCLIFLSAYLPIFVRYGKVFFWAAETLLAFLYAFSLFAVVKGWGRTVKLVYTIYAFLLPCLIGAYALLAGGFFTVVTSVEDLRQWIERAGSLAWIAFTLLQFLQVVLLPIPGMVSTTVGIALFGPFLCLILSLIGIELGSLTAFLIGRKFGYRAVSWLVGKQELDKWLKKMKGKDSTLLTIAFLFPFFPDDILCFVAGLSTMSFAFFAVMSLVTRAIAIACTCYSVNFIPFNTWWGILIWAGIFVLLALVFFLIYRNLEALQRRFFGKRKRN